MTHLTPDSQPSTSRQFVACSQVVPDGLLLMTIGGVEYWVLITLAGVEYLAVGSF